MVSRQAEWQQKMRAQQRCAVCGKPQFTSGYCQEHYEKRQQRYKGKLDASTKTCSRCGEVGHNKRTCPSRQAAQELREKIEGVTRPSEDLTDKKE